ncbi:hypothetical protein D3C76_1820740 [compost metagenome]
MITGPVWMIVIYRNLTGYVGNRNGKFTAWIICPKQHIGNGLCTFFSRIPGFKNRICIRVCCIT